MLLMLMNPLTVIDNIFYSGWACADDLMYLTEGKVYAALMNLFHAPLVSVKHKLSCHITTVRNNY